MRILAGAIGLLLLASMAPAQDPENKDDLGSNLNGVNLHVLTEVVQRITGKAFLWSNDHNLKSKTVHFKSDIPLKDPDVLFSVYKGLMKVSGFALSEKVVDGKIVYMIGPTAIKGKDGTVPLVEGIPDPSHRFVTRLFSLKYITAREVHAALINKASNPQGLFPIDSAGVIMITDYDYNIALFARIIEKMDVKKPDIELKMVQLKNALASDLEVMLNNLVQTIIQAPARGGRVIPGQIGRPEQVKIAADRRTNSLVILAGTSRMEQVIDLVARLDSETGFETSGIYIVHLRHTNSVDIVKTLNAMYGVSTDDQGIPSSGSGARPGQPSGPGRPDGGRPGAPRSSTDDSVPTIVADAPSNSVIVVTDRNTYRTIEGVVKRLDQRRPQVLIKATVVEVRSNEDFDLGAELNYLVDPTDRAVGLARQNSGFSTIIPDPVNNEFNIAPIDTPGITLGILKDRIGNIGALLKASESEAKVTILDEPEAATVDNGSAEMKVTQQVPILQTTITGTGIAQTTFSRFETAETTLSISPHISEGGYLRLDTRVKIEKFVRTTAQDPTIPPPKTSREINTNSILVPNGQTVVIGGIVTQDESKTVSGTPILSDIPIFGLLFQREQEEVEKRTLYIFITPYILYDDKFGDFQKLTKGRKDTIEELRNKPIEGLALDAPREPGAKSLFKFTAAIKEDD